MVSVEHNSLQHIEHWIMLTSGCAPLLPEDWCLGGMEWVGSELVSRWVRIIQCGVNISGAVDGFNWVEGSREWKIEEKFAEKVVIDDAEDDILEESEDDKNDLEEVKTLKVSWFFVGITK